MFRSTAPGRGALAAAFALAAIHAAPAAHALDLAAYLAEVRASNPMLASARAMADAAHARVRQAGAWDSPMLELGVTNVPTRGGFDADPMTMKMVGISQRIPLPGARSASVAAAGAGWTAAQAAAGESELETEGLAVEAYADAYYSRQLAEAAVAHQDFMGQLLQAARARIASGTGRLDEALRAEAELARTRADAARAEADFSAAASRAQALRGAPPGEALDSLSDPALAAVPESASALLDAAGATHPKLRQLDATATRYREGARAARRMATLPDVELRANYGLRSTLRDGTPQDNMWSAAVAFELPFFSGSRERSEAAEMDAMARATQSERANAELTLKQQVLEAYARALAAERDVRLLEDTVTVVQRRALEAAWSAYRAGQGDLGRVFEAGHDLYGEEVAAVRARQDLARGWARLIGLTGRADLAGLQLPPGKE